MRINRQDTNGVKPLLAVGEFGYDNYHSGGDIGRVYVGTGSSNIAQAKKSEVVTVDGKVDTHVARNDNPHSVTKTQVGLSNVDNTSDTNKPISTSTQNALDLKQNVLVSGTNIKTIEGQSIVGPGNIDLTKTNVGLNNVDNTADTSKVVASAGKWTTSRLINGTAVDGTVDITTSQWGTSRNITIGSTAKSVNGSADTSWSLAEIGAIGTSSPAFTGIPTAPTAAVGTNTTQLATTAFVNAEIANYTYSKAQLYAGQLDNRYYTEAEIDTLYNTTVKLTGNQTVDGIKTFSSSPIVPAPTIDFHSVPLRSTNITVNVGAGQTYTTINQALEYLSGFYPMYKKSGITATINLKAGFVMAEQVLVSGIDLGWINIVGEDSETIITHTALTTIFYGNYPAFGVDKGGTSPVIVQLFRFNAEKAGGNKHGLMTLGAGSSAYVLPNKGFIGAGTYGIYAYGGSTVNAEGANCSNAGDSGILASSCSTVNANSANCSNAGTCGIYVLQASTVNANSANCSNAGTCGIYAYGGSTINANSAIIQNQTTGTARVRVAEGSHIEATGINTTGGTVPALSQAVNTLTANGIIYQ